MNLVRRKIIVRVGVTITRKNMKGTSHVCFVVHVIGCVKLYLGVIKGTSALHLEGNTAMQGLRDGPATLF